MSSAGTVTLMFTDAKGSTSLLGSLGQERAEPVLSAYHEAIRRTVEQHGGREVKWMHDGGLYSFGSAAAALHCAIAVQRRCRTHVAGHRLATRIGLDAGEPAQQGDDYFGFAAVVASRLCDRADAERGQILCTHTVRGLLAGQRTFAFKGPRLEQLHGLEEAVAVFQVDYDGDGARVVPARLPFVGRAPELAALHAALERAIGGEGGLVWLSGEAGIGKTRILEEFSSLASGRARVLFGSCREGDAARPYAPFAEALAAYAGDSDAGQLREAFGERAGLIARFVPELRARFSDIPEPQDLPRHEELFRVLDAVSKTLTAIARARPLLLVLDDLHWADRGTVDMLLDVGRFAGDNPLLIAGLYRGDAVSLPGDHPLRRCLAELPKNLSNHTEIVLTGLDRADVQDLLTSIEDQSSVEASANLCDYTGGNPFFIRETLTRLHDEGLPLDPGSGLGTTQRVFEVVRRRVSRLSDEARELLSVACAFEGTFDFDLVQTACGLDPQSAVDAIDESISAQILWPGRQAQHYQFIHALVREVLYADLGPQHRIAQHRRIARALEDLPEDRPQRAPEIAHQYSLTGAPEDARRAAEYALLAADQAERVHDYARVGKFCGWALRMMSEEDGRIPGLMRRLAFSRAWALEAEAPGTALEAAERTALTEGAEAAANFLAQVHVILRETGAVTADLMSVIDRGLEYVRGLEHHGPAWMSFTLTLSRVDPRSFTYRERSRDLEEAFRIGEQLDPDESERYGFRSRMPHDRDEAFRSPNPADWMWYCGEYEISLDRLRRRAEEGEREGRIRRALDSWAFVSRCCSTLGRLDQASDAIKRAARLMQRIPTSGVALLQVQGAREDLRRARGYTMPESVIRSLEDGVGSGRSPSTDHRSGLEGPEEEMGRPWAVAPLLAALAASHAELGRRDDALRHLRSLEDVLLHAFVGWDMYQSVAWLAAETLWWLDAGDQTAALRVIEQGIEQKIRQPGFAQSMTDARLALARLAALRGEVDLATELFVEAKEVLEKQNARTLLAIADYDEALMHHRRGPAGDREILDARLGAAVEQFHRLSMRGWVGRARRLAERRDTVDV